MLFIICLKVCQCVVVLKCPITAGGVASVGERVTFSSPDENARAGETAPKLQCQPTLATPLVRHCYLLNRLLFLIKFCCESGLTSNCLNTNTS